MEFVDTTHTHETLHPHGVNFQGIRSRANISNTRGDHLRQQRNKFLHSKDIHFRAHISNTRQQVTIFGSFHLAAEVSFIPRTSVFVRVFQTLEVTIFGSIFTSIWIPRTSFLVQIFQTFEVTIFGSPRTSLFIPRTSVFVRVFQTLEVWHPFRQQYFKQVHSAQKTSMFIPRTPVLVQIFQTLEVTILGSSTTSLHPKDTRFRANISNTRGDHFGSSCTSLFHPKEHFRARISNTRGDLLRQH